MARGSLGFTFVVGLLSVSVAVNASADPIRISGRVGDRQGSAVADARVTLIQMIYAEAAFVPDPKVVDETTTAGDGMFSLTIPQGIDPKKESYVVVRKEGLSLGWAPWRVQDSQRVDIALGVGKDLAGEVVDENGRPVADAQVRISAVMANRDANRSGSVTPAFLRAQTDGRGRFVFADMPAEASYEFLVEKPGRVVVNTLERMASIRDGYQFSPGQAGIKVILPAEAVVRGIVVSKMDGRPIAGASVVALSDSARGMLLSPRPAVSTPDGTFRIGGLAADSYSVQIAVPGDRAEELTVEPTLVALQAGETKSGVKLQLGSGGVIEVAVSEPAGGPVANAMVNVFTVRRDRRFNGFTDANGVARIRVPAGDYEVTGVIKEGHGSPTIRDEVISVEDGRTVRASCVVRPSEAAGIVRDPAGNPLPGVKFAVLPMSRSEAASDSSGRFEIAWDPMPFPGENTPLVLVARDVTRNLALVVDLGGELDHLDIKLKPGLTFAGTVLDQKGKPLQRARVRVELRVSAWIASVDPNDVILTGPDGVFEAKAVPAGRQYSVSAAADGYGRLDIPVDASNLKDGRWEAGPFQLSPADQSITGVVVDSNGQPVAGAEIFAYGDGQPDPRDIQTDAGGGFVIQGVCKGVVRLSVRTSRPPVLSAFADVEAGATDVRIVVSEDGGRGQYVPRKPAPLKGKPLPSLKDLGIDPSPDTEGKKLLVCFWDMGQRPSRNCVTQLAARAAQLGGKGVLIVAVQAAKVEGDALSRWIEENSVPFQVGQISGGAEETRFAWGVASLPHLILADREHTVVAEGFGPADLDKLIEAASGR